MKLFEAYLVENVGMPIEAMYWVAGVTIFVSCLTIDLLRRFLLHFVRDFNGKLLQGIDAKYEALLDYLSGEKAR